MPNKFDVRSLRESNLKKRSPKMKMTILFIVCLFAVPAMAYTAGDVDATSSVAYVVVTNDPSVGDNEASDLFNAISVPPVEVSPGEFYKGPLYTIDRNFVIQCVNSHNFTKCVMEISKGPSSSISRPHR